MPFSLYFEHINRKELMPQPLTRKLTITCAICRAVRNESNHWWSLDYNLKTRSMLIYPLEIPAKEFSTLGQINVMTVDVCGIEHLNLAESLVRDGKDPFEHALR